MKAKNLSKALLVGTARMLTIASGFLLRITEQKVPENHSNPLADREESAPKDHESDPAEKWPEAWAQRISEANNVTWFSFDVNQDMKIQHQKPALHRARRLDKNPMTDPQPIVCDILEEIQQAGVANPPRMGKNSPSVGANTRSSSADAPRVFDSKKRFWVQKDPEKPQPQKRKNENPVVREPKNTGPGAECHQASEPFVETRVQPTEVTLKSDDRREISMPEEIPDDTRPARTPVHIFSQDDHTLRASGEMPSDEPGRQKPMALRPEPVLNDDDLTMDRLSVEKNVEDEPPFSGKWPDFIATDAPSSAPAAPPVSYLMQEPDNTQAERREMFRNEPETEEENHWPELENFTAHPELTEIEKNPENPDRILRLKQEQKGSLWSVLRF